MKQRRFPRVEELDPRNTPSAVVFVSNANFPLSGVLPDLGAGEPITIQGTLHVITREIVDDGGGVHFAVLINAENLDGVGTVTGTHYRIQTGAVDFANVNPGATVQCLESTLHFVSQGPGDNFDMHIVEHFTFNANGELTAAQFLSDTRTNG